MEVDINQLAKEKLVDSQVLKIQASMWGSTLSDEVAGNGCEYTNIFPLEYEFRMKC